MAEQQKHKISLPASHYRNSDSCNEWLFNLVIDSFVNGTFIIHSKSHALWNARKWKWGKVLLVALLDLSLLPLITFYVPTSYQVPVAFIVPISFILPGAFNVPIISTSLHREYHFCFFWNPFWLDPTRLVSCCHNLALNRLALLKIACLMIGIVTFYVPLIQYFLIFRINLKFKK